MTGQEYIQRQINLVKQQIKGSKVKFIVTDIDPVTKLQYDFYENELQTLESIEKSLKALEVLKKLFRNPDGCSMLALVDWEYPDTSFRIESTDDSWIHTEISKEEFNLLKEVLE